MIGLNNFYEPLKIVSEAQSCTVLSHVFYFSTQEAVMSKKPFKHRKHGRSLSCWCGEQLLTTSMPTCSFTRLPMMRHQDTTALCSGSFCSGYLKITWFKVPVFLYSVFVRLWFLPILFILSLVSLLWVRFFFHVWRIKTLHFLSIWLPICTSSCLVYLARWHLIAVSSHFLWGQCS